MVGAQRIMHEAAVGHVTARDNERRGSLCRMTPTATSLHVPAGIANGGRPDPSLFPLIRFADIARSARALFCWEEWL